MALHLFYKEWLKTKWFVLASLLLGVGTILYAFIGLNSNIINADGGSNYVFEWFTQAAGKTGVFRVSAYVANSDESIKTKTVAFNIICAVAAGTEGADSTVMSFFFYPDDTKTIEAEVVVNYSGVLKTVFCKFRIASPSVR